MQKIAKGEDYKALKSDKNAKELEEFLSYYDFLQKQIVALKNRLESETLKGNKWISKELQVNLKSLRKNRTRSWRKCWESSVGTRNSQNVLTASNR